MKNTENSLIWDTSLSGLALTGLSGSIVKVNKTFCDILEYNRDELLSMSHVDITHNDDIRTEIRLNKKIIKGKIGLYDIRKRYLSKTGKSVWVISRCEPVYNKEGRINALMYQVLPISSQVPLSASIKKIRAGWPIIITLLSALAYFTSEVVKFFSFHK